MKIVGAVAKSTGHADTLARQVANASRRGAATVVDPLLATDSVSLFAVRRPEESLADVCKAASPDGSDYLWFAGEWLTGESLTAQDACDVDRALERVRRDVEGDYVGVRVRPGRSVDLYTDTWGLGWCFVRALPGAVVFGSDFGAVCRAGDADLTLDEDAALLELAIGFVPADRTLFREVTVAPPGAHIEIVDAIPRIVDRHVFRYGNEWAEAPLARKLARLDELFQPIADRIATLAHGHPAISLSAGFDSRYALAWLSRRQAAGPLLTFGELQSGEVIDARAIAHEHAGQPHDIFVIEGTDYDAWRSMIQSLGNAGIVQWCGWADNWLSYVRAHSHNCVTGYLGDATSGKRMDMLARYDARFGGDPWADRWLGFELDMGEWAGSRWLREDAAARVRTVGVDEFAALLRSAEVAEPHQRAHHCNVVGRQRRWTGTQNVLMSAYVKPLPFFVDRAYRDFWMNVALDDLLGQTLYHRYAEDRFPQLFPRTTSASRFARRVVNRVRRELGALRGQAPPPKRPPPIVRDKLLAGHHAAILSQLDRLAPTLDAWIDVAAMRRGIEALRAGRPAEGLTSTMLFRVTNLMHLLELRDRTRQPHPAARPIPAPG